MGGVYADDTSNNPQLHGTTLEYSASFKLYEYDNGTVINLDESFEFSQSPTAEPNGLSTLLITFPDGTMKAVNLGLLDLPNGKRNTIITIYSEDAPSDVLIDITLWIKETWIVTDAEFTYEFNYKP